MATASLSVIAAIDAKTCSICRIAKPHSEFERHPGRGFARGQCRPCRRERNLAYNKTEAVRESKRRYGRLRRYGLTDAEFAELFAAQNGCCAVCGKPNDYSNRKSSLQVDHCHQTGRVRGLLCPRCNVFLGKLGDDIEAVQRYLTYLSGSSATPSAEEKP